MGLFGGKNKEAAKKGPAPAEAPTSTRRSVRRVVPTKPGQARPGSPAARPATRQAPAPAPVARQQDEMAIDDVQLPPPEIDQLDLGSAPPAADPTPARPPSTRPILASAAPDFAGDLGAARSGPARTGDGLLVEFLTGKAGLMSAEQAAAVSQKAGQEGLPLDEAAVRMGLITEEQLVNALSQETWVPHLKVDKYEIRKKALDTITREDAVHYGVFPVDKLGSLLTLAMVNPLDAESIRALEQKTGLDIKKVVASRGEINQAIDKYYGGKVVASDGSRSFTQDSDVPAKSATQMLRGADAVVDTVSDPLPDLASEPVAIPSPFDSTPPKPASNIQPEISADIQDIDDLLGGEETIAPAIIEPVSIKPEESSDALELSDAAISPAAHQSDLDFGEAPKADTSALSKPMIGDDRHPTEELPLPLAAPSAAGSRAPRAGRPGELPSATARITAGGTAGAKVVNLVPVLEDEFRYAISHGKAKVFERWVALQTRNRIVNAVTVEKELDGVLAQLYVAVRKAG